MDGSGLVVLMGFTNSLRLVDSAPAHGFSRVAAVVSETGLSDLQEQVWSFVSAVFRFGNVVGVGFGGL